MSEHAKNEKSNESAYPMVAVADALATVLQHCAPGRPVTLALADAAGHFLAEPVVAAEPLPPFPASTKDGYAVIAADGPGDYPVIGESTAGRAPDFTLRPGAVAYITTGAPLPPGADAVVMVEEVEPAPGLSPAVRIRRAVSPGADVRPVGYDVALGEVLLPAGARLGAAEIGLCATAGAATVTVYPRPVVAILSTGDELVDGSGPLAPGQIRDSNRATLKAAAEAAGARVIDLGIVRDEQAALDAAIAGGLEQAQMVLTSGGVSMGTLDFVKPLLAARGQVHFGRLNMKPGKPCTFATVDTAHGRRLVFGLPGNPVSSLVTFYLLGVPALRKLAGHAQPALPQVRAQLAQPLALDPQRPEYHRAQLVWENGQAGAAGCFVAVSTGNQASSRLLSMKGANALLELPQGKGTLPAGAVVTALIIGPLES